MAGGGAPLGRIGAEAMRKMALCNGFNRALCLSVLFLPTGLRVPMRLLAFTQLLTATLLELLMRSPRPTTTATRAANLRR